MNDIYTLLLRLEGPMQSWGYRSRFDYRDTALEPTRSGVIGLICAAMGIARGEDISRFDAIRMGVRVDREGRPERDYHTALDVIKADGSGIDTVQSWRDYLADASFTIGLESSNTGLLDEIAEALKSPIWPLFLGRKAFTLAVPPVHPSDTSKPGALEAHLLSGESKGGGIPVRLSITELVEETHLPGESGVRVVLDAPDGERTQMDSPLCFGKRRFRPRSVQTRFVKESGG